MSYGYNGIVFWKSRSIEPCNIISLSGNLCEFETPSGTYCYNRSSKKTQVRTDWDEENHMYIWKPSTKEVEQIKYTIE